ncbi:hypothetical protein DICPUDRAFT_8582, partial [Dictyostelium purpureum]
SSAFAIIVKYDIPKLIEQGKNNSLELAKELEFDGQYFYRILRFLSREGLFIEMEEPYCFTNSPLSKLLVNDNGAINHVKMALNPKIMESWLHLEDSIKSGSSKAFQSIGYPNLWAFSSQNDDFKTCFIKAMSFQTQSNHSILSEFSNQMGESKVVCDIGGSSGKLLSDLIPLYPSIEKAINFDLPMAINSEFSQGFIKSLAPEIKSKLEYKPGDFFKAETIPENADLYIMKRVIHDWSNEKSTVIINNVYSKMKPNTYLVLLEGILPPKNQPDFHAIFDILNLHVIGGQERTTEEWEQLISATNFKSIESIES